MEKSIKKYSPSLPAGRGLGGRYEIKRRGLGGRYDKKAQGRGQMAKVGFR